MPGHVVAIRVSAIVRLADAIPEGATEPAEPWRAVREGGRLAAPAPHDVPTLPDECVPETPAAVVLVMGVLIPPRPRRVTMSQVLEGTAHTGVVHSSARDTTVSLAPAE